MSKCPYNDAIECSADCRHTEFLRQLNIDLRSGDSYFDLAKIHTECGVRYWHCMRLMSEKQAVR